MDDSDKSKFNMGIAMLIRINGLINDLVNAKEDGNFPLMFRILVALNSEMRFTYDKDLTKWDIETQNLIAEYVNDKIDRGVTYSLLTLYEDFVRQQLSDRDMLFAKKEDIRRAMLNY